MFVPEGYCLIYIGFLGICYPKVYGLLVGILVRNRVSILLSLVSNGISNFSQVLNRVGKILNRVGKIIIS